MPALLDPLVGGLCIGAAAGLHLLLNDSILGISGIATCALKAPAATLRTPGRHQTLLLLSAFLLTTTVLSPSPALLPSPGTLLPAGAASSALVQASPRAAPPATASAAWAASRALPRSRRNRHARRRSDSRPPPAEPRPHPWLWWGGYLAGALAGERLKGKI